MTTAYNYVCDQVWAITETGLNKVLGIAARVELKDLKELSLKNPNNTRKLKSNIQVIDIIGPIVKHGDMFSDVSGARSLEGIKEEFVAALQDDTVTGILFNIDSPGGEAGGINDFAELVYSSRSIKPIKAYTPDMCCSAAYWIGSATEEIMTSETATLGSIGCIATIRDTTERDAKLGIKDLKFISSNSPNKRPDPTSKEGKAEIQYQVDTLANIFINKVARNRSNGDRELEFEDVVTKFNKGGVLIGKKAVKVGLADSMGSFEDALKSFTVTKKTTKEINMEATELNKQNGETTEEAVVTAKTSAKTTEPTVDAKTAELLQAMQDQNAKLLETVQGLGARLEEAEKNNKTLEADAIASKAEVVASSLSTKLVPATREKFVADYIRAATDDRQFPIEGYSRVDNFVAIYQAMPESKLTEETFIVDSQREDDDTEAKFAEMDATALEYARKLSGKK